MRVAAASVLVASVGACSLFTSLDGYSRDVVLVEAGGPASADGGGGGGPDPTAYRAAVVADRPILYLRFEETEGAVAKNEVGPTDGTHENVTVGVPGLFAGTRAVAFDRGRRANVSLPSATFQFAGSTPFTLEAWVNAGDLARDRWIGGTEAPTAPRSGWSVFVDNGARLRYQTWDPAASAGVTRSATCDACRITPGRFQHLVVAYDGTRTVSFYVDGALAEKASESGVATIGGDRLVFGCRRAVNTGLQDCLEGWVVDELAVYDYALSPEQVSAHHALGR